MDQYRHVRAALACRRHQRARRHCAADGQVRQPMAASIQRYFRGLSRNTFLLAATSLFADISTEMLYPVLPVFLTQTLKASGSIVGLVDGFAQATQDRKRT